MKKLENLIKLSSKVTIIVPATININETIDNTKYVNDVASKLSNWFGGATASKAVGFWLSDTEGLVREYSTPVFSYCNQSDLDNHIDELIDLCDKLKKEMSQDAMALEINGEMYFI